MNKDEKRAISARALRAAGYIPLPRLWVTKQQLLIIKRLAEENREAVNEIRAKAKRDSAYD